MTIYTVTAKRWAHGWELHIDGVGVTQSRTLADAERMVRDYIETALDIDVSRVGIDITPDLGGVEAHVREARALTERAAEIQREAAAEARRVAKELRENCGLSVSDTAAVMHISRGRVSQLVSH